MSFFIVVTGNPVVGFSHYGPFDDNEEALEWADNARGGFAFVDPWWVVELRNPNV